MSDDIPDFTDEIDTVGTPDGEDPDHDPTNGRWLETRVAETLGQWGYRTARNEYCFGLETDVIARRDDLRGDPDDFLVVECKDWHQVPVQRDAVEAVALRAALMRAMPVLTGTKSRFSGTPSKQSRCGPRSCGQCPSSLSPAVSVRVRGG
ncbi:hypothetical protein C462_08145 [Halorubrum distributum JCM 13916]|uniref:Restriction endonuclease type IV Mrr domain-containing protein n=1 Tax=Halorubrum distributum JCM 13916 TaxID=1230455 RepID=M0PQF1_9EURY|nr:hypothetical protein C462_08145 [Halorubrum arcis JCM 13916]